MQGIIVLIVYALLMVGATKAFTKREDGGESFHVGHRNMGMVASAMSIAATWIWTAGIYVLFRREGQLMHGTADLQPCAERKDQSKPTCSAVHRRGSHIPMH